MSQEIVMRNRVITMVLAGLLALFGAACEDTTEGLEQDVEEGAGAVEGEVEEGTGAVEEEVEGDD